MPLLGAIAERLSFARPRELSFIIGRHFDISGVYMFLFSSLMTISVICAFLVIYPYLIYPKILKLFKTSPLLPPARHDCDGSRLTLVFCAYNEAKSLPEKLENLKALRQIYPQLQCLAFDDGSNDGSAEMIAREAPFVQLLRGQGRNGKAYGMKRLVPLATGEFLIFTDANVLLDLEAPALIERHYADPQIGGICGALHYIKGDLTPTAHIGGRYRQLEEKIKDLEALSGSVMGADGAIFSIRRALYPSFPDTVLDDFTVSMSVIFAGKRLVKVNAIKAYERLVTARSDEFARKVRIAVRAYHTHQVLKENLAGLQPMDRFKYISHKFLRWFGGAFLALGTLSGLLGVMLLSPLAALAVMAAGLALCGWGMRAKGGAFAAVFEIILAMLATFIGVIKAAKGQTFTTWKPAQSR